jgi:flagellar assembly factor FliW
MPDRINKPQIINTSNFGEIEITPENVFYFENGILGFEMLNNFILISEEDVAPFKWLISIDEPNIIFPVISPWLVEPDYINEKQIDADNEIIFSIVTLNDGDGNITVNMKAPIILRVKELTGEQIILPFAKYDINHIIKHNN